MARTASCLALMLALAWSTAGAESPDPLGPRYGRGAVQKSAPPTKPTSSQGVTFESLNLPLNTQINPADGVPFTVEGYTFTPGPNNASGLNDSHFGNAVDFWAYNGTHVMGQHDDVVMTKVGGGTFNLRQFDFAGFPVNFEGPFRVTGQPGNVVANFVPDGIVDAIGGAVDFQTFTLPATFTNLTSVTWEMQSTAFLFGSFALDNIQADTTVADLPPDCSTATPSPSVLWPPNHQYVAISIDGLTDPDGDPLTVTVTGITQDEPSNAHADGNTCPDAQIVDGHAVVRAECAGSPGKPGNGRVYAIRFVAADGRGGTCQGVVDVCVPHDQGQGSTCIDDGQRYNSLGPCNAGDQLSPDVTATDLSVNSTGRQAVVSYSLAEPSEVDLSVFDVAGRRLATIEHTFREAGRYNVTWQTDRPRGLYFYRLRAGSTVVTRAVLGGK